jgi:prepilin-type N-terminal cleavage/methylation domain-containing protein
MRPTRVSARRGFTLIELLVASAIALMLMGGVVQLLTVQGHGYRKQREVIDVRETAREATALLSSDLRQASVGGSSPTAIAPNSITLRSSRGLGTVCAKHPTLPRYGLWRTGGNILATADDSALIYQPAREKWVALKVTAVGTPAAMGVAACAWPGARPPDVVVEVAVTSKKDTSGILVGAAYRGYRKVQYAEFTGPLLAPASNGLEFAYYDSTGAVTANPALVKTVAFTLRTESYKNTYVGTGYTYQRDSLTTKVAFR